MEKVFASAVALVVVASVHFGLEQTVENLVGENYAQYATAGIAIVLGIIALLVLEYLSENLYDSSGRLRCYVHWLHGKPYFEGWWVDVGVDESAGIPEILSCSFIIILYDKGELKIEGLTWETRSLDQQHWDSIYCAEKVLDLYFDYKYTSAKAGVSVQGHETAQYHFMMDRTSFEGTYDGDKFISHGKINRLNKRWFGSNYRFPSYEHREQCAKTYMKYYVRKHEFDPNTFRRRVLSQSKARREDSFVRFVKQSTSKADEVKLLNKALQSVSWSSPIRSILDLGAGEGTLTVSALKALKFESYAGKYVGIDSNGIILEALSTRLQSECGRNEDANTILMRRTIDDFALNDVGHFDVVLACHCLYFVDNVSSVLSAIFARILEKGGRFVSMHTDIMSEKAKIIKQLAENFNRRLKLDIIDQIKKSARDAGMCCLFECEADIILTFPHLDRHGWTRVADNGEGDDVAKVIELISFIVDRGPDEFKDPIKWKDCVHKIRSHLELNKDQMLFPIVSHVFEKE
jgi:SAM-dependent methyltransferase